MAGVRSPAEPLIPKGSSDQQKGLTMEKFEHDGATITVALDLSAPCPIEEGGAVAIEEIPDYGIAELRGFNPAEDDGTRYHEYTYTADHLYWEPRFRVVVDRAKVAEMYQLDEADDEVCEWHGDQEALDYALWAHCTGYIFRVDRPDTVEGIVIPGIFFPDGEPTRDEILGVLRAEGAIN